MEHEEQPARQALLPLYDWVVSSSEPPPALEILVPFLSSSLGSDPAIDSPPTLATEACHDSGRPSFGLQ